MIECASFNDEPTDDGHEHRCIYSRDGHEEPHECDCGAEW